MSLPPGWRRRIAEGGAGMEFILSPEGRQYRSRSEATIYILNIITLSASPSKG